MHFTTSLGFLRSDVWHDKALLNVLVEWLALLHIREVTGSVLWPETAYPVWDISFSSFPPGKYWDSVLNQATITSLHIFYFVVYLTMLSQ
jgi:hypothetical protein